MKWIHWLDENFEEVLLIFLLIAITCIMGLQVFCRYILNNSLSWSEFFILVRRTYTFFIYLYVFYIDQLLYKKKYIDSN